MDPEPSSTPYSSPYTESRPQNPYARTPSKRAISCVTCAKAKTKCNRAVSIHGTHAYRNADVEYSYHHVLAASPKASSVSRDRLVAPPTIIDQALKEDVYHQRDITPWVLSLTPVNQPRLRTFHLWRKTNIDAACPTTVTTLLGRTIKPWLYQDIPCSLRFQHTRHTLLTRATRTVTVPKPA